jgi:hypothetical protein
MEPPEKLNALPITIQRRSLGQFPLLGQIATQNHRMLQFAFPYVNNSIMGDAGA